MQPDDHRQVGDEVRAEGVGAQPAQRGDPEDQQDAPAVRPHRLSRRRARDVLGALELRERRALVHLQADQQPDDRKRPGGEERDPPAPRTVGVLGHPGPRREHREGTADRGQRRERRRRGREQAAPVRGRVLGDERRRAGELAAAREALDQPQDREQDGCKHADRGVRRQQPDGHRRAAHHEDDRGEDVAPPDPVAEAAPEDAAQRPGEERDTVEREGREQCRRRVALREEQRGDDGNRRRVDREVEPLDEVADTAGGERADRRRGAPGRRDGIEGVGRDDDAPRREPGVGARGSGR